MNRLNLVQRELLHRYANSRLSEPEMEQVFNLLRRFICGEMNEVDSEAVITTLAENEQCMALLDSIGQQPIEMALAGVPDLDVITAHRVQNRLVSRMQRADLTTAVYRIGTHGFFAAALGLLRPFTHRNKKLRPRRKRSLR